MESKQVYIEEMNSNKRYYLSAFKSISNNSSTVITTYPTSEGTPMSDNAYREPYNITLSIISSEFNKSLNIKNEDTSTNYTYDLPLLKELLFKWKENFTRLILQTRYYQYTNMVVTNISWRDEDSTLGNFNPSITLSECRVASYTKEESGKFSGYESEPTYQPEIPTGNNSGLAETIGQYAAGGAIGLTVGATIGGIIGFLGGPIGAGVGAAIGAAAGVGITAAVTAVTNAGKSFGWW